MAAMRAAGTDRAQRHRPASVVEGDLYLTLAADPVGHVLHENFAIVRITGRQEHSPTRKGNVCDASHSAAPFPLPSCLPGRPVYRLACRGALRFRSRVLMPPQMVRPGSLQNRDQRWQPAVRPLWLEALHMRGG